MEKIMQENLVGIFKDFMYNEYLMGKFTTNLNNINWIKFDKKWRDYIKSITFDPNNKSEKESIVEKDLENSSAKIEKLKPLIKDEIRIKIKNAKKQEKPDEDKLKNILCNILVNNIDTKITIQELKIIHEVICDMIINTWYYIE